MDILTPSEDLLDQEIASKEADAARSQAKIAEAEAHVLKMKQDFEVTSLEVKILKRAASLRPATGSLATGSMTAAPRPVSTPTESVSAAAPPAGRFRDVVDQIRAGR